MSGRARAVRRVLAVTLALNVGVALAKVVYGGLVGSLAIRADGLHSGADAVNNLVLLVGTWFASRPPDREHPYGHQKIEVFASLALGAGLVLVAFDVARDAILRFVGTEAAPLPRIDLVAVPVLLGTLAVNILVSRYERREGERLMSPALTSDAAHTASDVLVTSGVAVSALLSWAGFAWLDVLMGGVVALVIAVVGGRIMKENAGYLVDRSLVPADLVVRLASSVAGVHAVRAVRSRGSPGGVWIDFAVAVDGGMSVSDAHALAHCAEHAVRQGVPGVAGVQVHVEPA